MEAFITPPRADSLEQLAFEVSSVGVWILVERDGRPAYFLAVQQADIEGNPWGIPAGHVEQGEIEASETAIKEVAQETGITLTPKDLHYITFRISDPAQTRGQILFISKIPIHQFDLSEAIMDPNGTIRFPPPPGVDQNEIMQMALIPLDIAFQDNVLNINPYHTNAIYRGYTALRRCGYIQGEFPFEDDPYL